MDRCGRLAADVPSAAHTPSCEHLPNYKAALDMTVDFKWLVAGFSRHHEYTLDAELGARLA